MALRTIGAYQARQNFGGILERAFYRGETFLVKRGKKAMAYLIGQPVFSALFELLEKDKALADTLALMTNSRAQRIIEAGTDDIKSDRTYPLESIVKDQ